MTVNYSLRIAFTYSITLILNTHLQYPSFLTFSGRSWVVLLTYELSNLLILGSIGVVFRPQEYSPFFFMVPARLNDARIRPIPILEGNS